MPIALDPSETFDFVLESDRGKPGPPALVFHHLTRRQLREWEKLIEQLKATDDDAAAETVLDEAIALGFVGLKNMPAGQPDDVLTILEKHEVAIGYVPQGMKLELEKKVSRSPSTSATDSSAPDAAPLPAA